MTEEQKAGIFGVGMAIVFLIIYIITASLGWWKWTI